MDCGRQKWARSTAASPFCFFLAESIWTMDVQRTELSRLEMVQRQPKPPGARRIILRIAGDAEEPHLFPGQRGKT